MIRLANERNLNKMLKNIKAKVILATASAVVVAALAPVAGADEAYKGSSGQVYFKNSTLELGLNPAAVFGAQNEIPEGFHPYYPNDWAGGGNTNALGIIAVADPSNPDWADTRGDFTTNWDRLMVSVDGDWWNNNHWNDCEGCGGISGAWDTPDATTGQLTWHQSGDNNGIHLDVTVKPVPGTTIVNTTYKLTNVRDYDIPGVALAVGDNTFPCADSTYGQVDITGQQGTSGVVTSITKSRGMDCNEKTQSTTWASPDIGSKASVFNCYISITDDFTSNPLEILNSTNSCMKRDFHGSTDKGLNISIPADPSNSNIVKAGQSVELHVARCMNASEAKVCGIKGLESAVHYPLTQVSRRTGGSLGGVGTVTFNVHGVAGHKYEISDDKYFRKGWKTAIDGDTVTLKVASTELRKGKVGKTTVWVRDAADRFATRSGVVMYWDFSPPYVKTASARKHRNGKVVEPGKFDVALTIKEAGNAASLNMDLLDFATRLQFDSGASVPSGVAFPSDSDPSVVDVPPRAITKLVVTSDAAPQWVRAMDNFGNVGVWRKVVVSAK